MNFSSTYDDQMERKGWRGCDVDVSSRRGAPIASAATNCCDKRESERLRKPCAEAAAAQPNPQNVERVARPTCKRRIS